MRTPSAPEGTTARPSETQQFALDLYQQEREGMVRLAHLLTGSLAAAEDVVQDAFLRLHSAPSRVDQPGAYLRSTVVNLCSSHHRRRAVERRWREAQPPPEFTLPPDVDEMWQTLATLPADQRESLVLRFYLDLKVADIAALLGRPAGTIKSHIHRGLATLREEVSP